MEPGTPAESTQGPAEGLSPDHPGDRRRHSRGPRRRSVSIAALCALLALAGLISAATASSADDHGRKESKTLVLDVRFSPQTLIAANNQRDPNSPLALGDENVFHDQLFVKGRHVGDEVGSCVIAALTPTIIANCGLVVRLPDGQITGQFATSPGPAPKPIALTGGTGAYRNIGGEATLVEFGNEKGTLTLELLFFRSESGRD
jgi:hypothetical protein